jgi:mRNA interferase MazF
MDKTTRPTSKPSVGEVWWVDLDPTKGREQRGRRPAVVVSVDEFNHGPAELIIVAPMTTKRKGIPFHVLTSDHGFVKCEDIRSISLERLLGRKGSVTSSEMGQVRGVMRLLLGI